MGNVDGFEWIGEDHLLKFNESFIENYDENSDKRHILEKDVKYPKNLHKLHSELPFLLEKILINKCEKLLCTVYNKKKTMLFI